MAIASVGGGPHQHPAVSMKVTFSAATALASAAFAMANIKSIGEAIVLICSVGVALGMMARMRPVKWVLHQMFGEPVTEAFRRAVTKANQPLYEDLEIVKRNIASMRAEMQTHIADVRESGEPG